jgi:hypothetical protein
MEDEKMNRMDWVFLIFIIGIVVFIGLVSWLASWREKERKKMNHGGR